MNGEREFLEGARVHVAGEYVGLVQDCSLCGRVLCDNRGTLAVDREPGQPLRNLSDLFAPDFYFPVGSFVEMGSDYALRVDGPATCNLEPVGILG